MHKPLIAAALVSLVALSGCAKPQTPPQQPSQQTGEQQPGPQTPTGPQATPDAVAETFLHAVGNGNAEQACDVMAIEGRPVNEAGIGEACTQMLAPTLQQAQNAEAFRTATVKGAKVTGETADYSSAQVNPEAVRQMLGSLRGTKIDDKWFVTSA